MPLAGWLLPDRWPAIFRCSASSAAQRDSSRADRAPDDLRERLAAAFGMHAVYRQDTRQATVI
jgi:hypothetical protein